MPDKYLELFDNFLKLGIAGMVVAVMGVAGVIILLTILDRRRTTKDNNRLIDTFAEFDKEHKAQRDEAVGLVKALTTRLESTETEREEDRKKYKASIDGFSNLMQAEQQIKLHQLSFDQRRTEAYEQTAKSLDGMRVETSEWLTKERSNIEEIVNRMEAQSTSLSALETASGNLPEAVAVAVKTELADILSQFNSFLGNLESSKAEIVNKFDQAKDEVIARINSLQATLTVIANKPSDLPPLVVGTAAETTALTAS